MAFDVRKNWSTTSNGEKIVADMAQRGGNKKRIC